MENILSVIVRVLVCIWIIIKIVSWKLWLADRTIPQVPVIVLIPLLQAILFYGFFIIAVGLFFKPFNTYLIIALLLIETISMLADELRWQPWQYQFLFIFFSLLINKRKPQLAVNNIILILASTYLFSGLHKINVGFLQNVWLKLILVRFLHFPHSIYYNRFVRYAGLIVPLLEIAAGILILLPKQRKIFSFLPIGIHVFVWLFLGSDGIQHNQTVLPWNVAMAIIIYILFIRNRNRFSFKNIIYSWNVIIAIAWLMLPVAGLLGYWDRYFSSALYTGNDKYMSICIADTIIIPPELAPYITYSKNGFHGVHQFINVQKWGIEELKVSVPPEHRIYKSIENSFRSKYGYLQPEFVYY